MVLYQGKILDGKIRYRACIAAGVEPRFVTYGGDDPVSYLISLNLKRRHLSESQRAMVAAKLARLRQGARTDLSPIGERSQAQAAELLNVGKRSVERATAVRDHGAPELVQAVERGRLAVSVAADIAAQPIDEQREIVARGEKEILRVAAEIRASRTEYRRAERVAILIAASNASAPLPDRRVPIILADPPYQYERRWSASRDIQNHYPTMATKEICALPVAKLATPDAMLFLWTPAPLS
jgi:hypothetical protein